MNRLHNEENKLIQPGGRGDLLGAKGTHCTNLVHSDTVAKKKHDWSAKKNYFEATKALAMEQEFFVSV
jgi:hypothetical protein